MIRFLDFQETLALACAATGHFFVYSEQEAPVLIARLRSKKEVRAVLFETTLSLDVCSLALSYDISMLFPVSLEELYRMLINAPATAIIYVCSEVMRMREAYETSGYLIAKELRQIPKIICDAIARGDIERALCAYEELEKAHEPERTLRGAFESSHRRAKLMKVHKKGNASVCVIALGYTSTMVEYLLSKSSIDVVIVSGFNRRVMRELKLLAGGYEQIIWVAPSETICSGMICDKGVRRIITRNIDELHNRLMTVLPRKLRNELHYPGRPEEWPVRYLPDIPKPERRMCPGCVYRGRMVESAHCEKLGIDVYRSEENMRLFDERINGFGSAGHAVIGRAGEGCRKTYDRMYAVKRYLCDGCGHCLRTCGCPAIIIDSLGVSIDSVMCTGCGDCGEICEKGAIYSFDLLRKGT